MPAKALSMADIPDMDDDVDIGGLPSWSAKPKAAAAKPAPAPASKPASYYAAQAEDSSGSGKGSRYGSGPYSEGSKYTPKPVETSSYQPKARQPEPEPEPEPEPAPASAIDIAPLDMDERDRIAAQIEQELTLEGLGLPNYKKGDYGSATGPKMKVVDKGVWSGSTHTGTGGPAKTRAQLLREGKEVLSIREQKDAEAQAVKEEFAAAAVKMQCTFKDCTFQAVGKRGYCAAHQIEHNQRLESAKAAAAAPRPAAGAQYQQQAKHKCSACKQPVVGQVVEALGAHWHETCFCCRGCGAEFPSGKFVNIKGQPHCRACATSMAGAEPSGGGGGSSGTCNGCRRAITTEGVEAMGASWHKHCFVCTHCGKPFVNGKFASVKGEPFCNQQCFEARLGI